MAKTLALRIHGKEDLRLESFDLPPIQDDEILADVQSDSMCMSTYKFYKQGNDHKRTVGDLAKRPTMVGHEMCGTILQVGRKYEGKIKPGTKWSIQPALVIPGREYEAPGYSFEFLGGNATKVILPKEVMERDCFLTYEGEGFFAASLAEPVSCIVGGFNVMYHFAHGSYEHDMGIVKGGTLALLGGTGPMGLCAIDYALHGPRQPRLFIVTDIDQARLDRASSLFTQAEAKKCGVDLRFINTSQGNWIQDLQDLTGGKGYDDVFVFAPVPALIEAGSDLLGYNGCLNFFAGPSDPKFKAPINFYDVHYNYHHLASNSGGNTEDMRQSMELMSKGKLKPEVMITHIGGLDSAADTIAHLPDIPGGKKLIYNYISMPLTAISDFEAKANENPMFAKLAEISARHDGLWSLEAENYLLKNAPRIDGAE